MIKILKNSRLGQTLRRTSSTRHHHQEYSQSFLLLAIAALTTDLAAAPDPTHNPTASEAASSAQPSARPGERPWDRTEGVGRVEAHLGAYDDAIRVKHNTVTLYLVNHFGGHAPTPSSTCTPSSSAPRATAATAPRTRTAAPPNGCPT